MLRRFAFSNFQSFAERVEVDFTVNKQAQLTHFMHEDENGERTNKVMAVIGANASGKTSLIKGLGFLIWFIGSSFQSPKENEGMQFLPFATKAQEISSFELEFEMDGKLWRYELESSFSRVLKEALYTKIVRFNYVFVREWSEETQSYDVRQQNFGLAPKVASKVRENASLISTAVQHDIILALKIKIVLGAFANINSAGKMHMSQAKIVETAQTLVQRPHVKIEMETLLKTWDLGLSSIEFQLFEQATEKYWMPMGKHKTNNAEFTLPFTMESNGTQSAFILLPHLLSALEIGGIAIIDELENDLHPHMIPPILALFAKKSTNPHNAQLIFTCHALEVLNHLHKSQVLLVAKNAHCASEAWRLDSMEGVRADDNLYAKYMAGAYGAIPNFAE